MLKLMVVDDEPIERNGLKEFIQWDKLDIEVVGEASDGRQALSRAQVLKPDIRDKRSDRNGRIVSKIISIVERRFARTNMVR